MQILTVAKNTLRFGNQDLEACGTPVDKVDGLLGLDGGDGGVDVLGDDIPTIQEAHSHVFALHKGNSFVLFFVLFLFLEKLFLD